MKTPPGFRFPRFAASSAVGAVSLLCGLTLPSTLAHNLTGEPAHPHYDWSVRPPETVAAVWRIAQAGTPKSPALPPASSLRPAQAAAFDLFSPRVTLRWDQAFLYVESNGLPAHGMMVGITAWQQQVPLPQPYVGANAWRIPLYPVPAGQPQSIRNRFLRGAIALAVNGIPIFNPQNNRGELSQEIGELDQWGGHCGRADDYHYHAAPLHLQAVLGPALPIAFALDGYTIYGLTDPDGSAPAKLDAFNGHETAALGYHYHGSLKYPYVNGGFHGEVVEREGQVDPQPRAQGVREALPPLRGAKITGFTVTPDEKTYALRYTVNGRPAAVNYATAGDGVWNFHFANADGTARDEIYRAGERGGGGGKKGRPPPEKREPRPLSDARDPAAPADAPAKPSLFALRSPVVTDGGALPVEFTGDGASATLPLEWSGAPTGTQSYALIMHHIDPEGQTMWYWTLYNIPGDVRALPMNAQGIGTLGNSSVNRRVGYAPPHSKGPGAKIYTLTLYALSAPVQIAAPPSEVNRDRLLTAIKDLTLGSTELKMTYTRPAGAENSTKGKTGQADRARARDDSIH